MSSSSDLCRAAELIFRGDRIVAFTGAGMSTASGIPDFRSRETGIWTEHDPMEVASISAFRFAPERFFAWARPIAELIAAAQPNPAHTGLAELERPGDGFTIITQNIDNLHQRAGSSRVIEIHGNFRTLVCAGCRLTLDEADEIDPIMNGGGVPRCPVCAGVLKPSAVLFGEELPRTSWQAAEAACRSCDVLIVAGTSLEVYPAAWLPELALAHGAALIAINDAPTPLDRRADVCLRGRVETMLPAIAAEVRALG